MTTCKVGVFLCTDTTYDSKPRFTG